MDVPLEKTLYFTFNSDDQLEDYGNRCFLNLPYRLKPPPDHFFAIAADIVLINLEFPTSSPYFKVEIDEIRHEYCPSLERNLLCTIPNKGDKAVKFIHNSEQNIYTRIESPDLNRLTLRIQGANGVKLDLAKRNSLIGIKFRSMKKVEHFKLRVAGKVNTNFWGSSGLHAELPHEIQLRETGNWSIALESLHIPNPKKQATAGSIVAKNQNGKDFIFSYHLEQYAVPNGEDLLFAEMVEHFKKADPPIKVRRNDKGIVNFTAHPASYQLWFSKSIANVLGKIDSDFCNLHPNQVTAMKLPMSLARLPTECVLLKSDLVETSIFNKTFKPIIRAIPVKNHTDEWLHYEPKVLEFHDIKPSAFKEILFQLHDENGETIHFSNRNDLFLNFVMRHIDE